MTKPFDAAELLAKVQVYLRLKTVEEVDRLNIDVLSLLCHETNTPLHGPLLSAGMLLEDAVSPEEQKDCAEAIRHSVIQLHSLFEKVLKLSALKAQTVEWKLSEGNLCDVVQEVPFSRGSVAIFHTPSTVTSCHFMAASFSRRCAVRRARHTTAP